jgi:hypothetical protein
MKQAALALAILSLALASCEDDDASNGLNQSSVTEPGATPASSGDMTVMTVAPTVPADPAPPPPAVTPAATTPTVAPVDPVMPAPPTVTDGVSFEELPAALGKAFCERMFSCCGPSEAMTLVLGPQLTKDNCPALAPYYFGDYFKKYTLSVVEKRVTYFPEKVGACLDRLSSRSCEQFAESLYSTPNPYYPYNSPYYAGTVPPSAFACDDLFAPVQGPGELCQADQDCREGFCVATLGADKRCQALAQVGQACPSYPVNVRCAPDLYCASGICRQIGKEGDTCYDTYSATACESGLTCASGVYPAASTCKPKLADGSACTLAVNCKSGRCDYTGVAPNYYTCTPISQPPTAPPLACTGAR